ncbi:hypothetical protein P154DRAFT_529274 [Amniculicola lignicola CBS 123094]|uniref:BTB domain-containing protein n=1 Tax=Amniculicola lignicola CBS 123094 TaxID=1392246 RepID=A0A6A5X2X5_9PLEO|nr:hypothetical protein P154DRAFT_529274 [Amniculicola lignicola CBS 123094]
MGEDRLNSSFLPLSNNLSITMKEAGEHNTPCPRIKPYLARTPNLTITICDAASEASAQGKPSTETRNFTIPKSLLSGRSTYLHNAIISQHQTSTSGTIIPIFDTRPAMFQNFIDYLHSNIYSLNRQAVSFHPLLSHISAYILGEKLGAQQWKNAALRQLWSILNHLRTRPEEIPIGRDQSPVVPTTMLSVLCGIKDGGLPLKMLVSDALATQWSSAEILSVIREVDKLGVKGEWNEVRGLENIRWSWILARYDELRKHLVDSLKYGDERSWAWKDEEYYVGLGESSVVPKKERKEKREKRRRGSSGEKEREREMSRIRKERRRRRSSGKSKIVEAWEKVGDRMKTTRADELGESL